MNFDDLKYRPFNSNPFRNRGITFEFKFDNVSMGEWKIDTENLIGTLKDEHK